MRWGLPLCVLMTLGGCGGGGNDAPATPISPAVTVAPVWEPPLEAAPAGTGYALTPIGAVTGGPEALVVSSDGWAFLGASEVFKEQGSFESWRSWGNAYDPRTGWRTPVRLVADPQPGAARDACNGIGLTPDGAAFGWSADRLVWTAGLGITTPSSTWYGLNGFDVRRGWVGAGTLLTHDGTPRTSLTTTARDGIPYVAYGPTAGTFVMRHVGVLEGPELVLPGRSPGALVADDAGNVAVSSGNAFAILTPEGRWLQTSVPGGGGSTSVAPVPGGGFLVAWYELGGSLGDETVRYKTATVDPAARWSAVTELGSAAAPRLEPRFGRAYNESPRAAAGAAGAAVVVWQAGEALFAARQTNGIWRTGERVPNAVPDGAYTRDVPGVSFAVTMDAASTVLLAWAEAASLRSSQQRVGQAWSASVAISSSAGWSSTGPSVLLATNASGTAFAAWRLGQRIMAARSPSR